MNVGFQGRKTDADSSVRARSAVQLLEMGRADFERLLQQHPSLGLAILQAIAAGERDPRKLAKLRDRRCHKSEEEIAEAVFLSPSRFRHLFVEETGMAFRPYVLWLRLQRAIECHTSGENLTNAAYTAGFSDLAHMSRTFRRMFGIAPGALDQQGAATSSIEFAPTRAGRE